jgi:hypothetical protein
MACNSPSRIFASPGLIDAAFHLHQHLAMRWFRSRHIRNLQNLDPTVPIESHCFHDLPPCFEPSPPAPMELKAIRDHLYIARLAIAYDHALSTRIRTVERALTPGDSL